MSRPIPLPRLLFEKAEPPFELYLLVCCLTRLACICIPPFAVPCLTPRAPLFGLTCFVCPPATPRPIPLPKPIPKPNAPNACSPSLSQQPTLVVFTSARCFEASFVHEQSLPLLDQRAECISTERAMSEWADYSNTQTFESTDESTKRR